jgi:hypothetical protein
MRPPMGNDPVEQTFPLVRMVARGGVEPRTFRFVIEPGGPHRLLLNAATSCRLQC